MTRFVNFLLYQAGWFACVLGAAWQRPGLGAFIASGLLLVHLVLTTTPAAQLKLLLVAALIGFLVDTCQLWIGVFLFTSGTVFAELPPPWLTIMWMQFASTICYSLHWLRKRYAISAIFGLLGGPLAFFAGEKLGAVTFLPPRLAHYAVLSLFWLVALPCLVFLADLLHRDGPSADYRYLSRHR